jgi:type IV pilus assembly protein PilW
MNMKRQRGVTLVELMLSSSIGITIVSSVITVYVATVGSSSDTLRMSKLNQELSTVMSVMTQDLRRAGYTGSANVATPTSNDFSNWDDTALRVAASITVPTPLAATGAGECILYSYDSDNDGVEDDTDMVGFRLNNGAIQMRQQGDVTNNTRHDNCNDTDDTWISVTDANLITVTNLAFSLANSQCLNTREPDLVDNDTDGSIDDSDEYDCYTDIPTAASGDVTVETREITITLAGQLASDTSIQLSQSQTVRVRNDLIRSR